MPKKQDKVQAAAPSQNIDVNGLIQALIPAALAGGSGGYESSPDDEERQAQRDALYTKLANADTGPSSATKATYGIMKALSGLGYLGGLEAGNTAMGRAREIERTALEDSRKENLASNARDLDLLRITDAVDAHKARTRTKGGNTALSLLGPIVRLKGQDEAQGRFDKSFPLNQRRLEMGITEQGLRDDRFNRGQNWREGKNRRDDIAKYAQNMIKDPIIKKLREKEYGYDVIDQIVAQAKGGNTTAAAGLGAKVAKAMYDEVGVLTNEDVARYVRSGLITRQAGDKLTQWMTGHPTEATLDEIQQMERVMKEVGMGRIQGNVNRYLREYANPRGIDPEEAGAWLQFDYRDDGKGVQFPEGTGPGAASPPAANRKQVDGVWYRKVAGGWEAE